MPFAQFHYPFENEAWFEEHFPADFIVEYINQTRGWFYTMHVLATALFDRPAFSNVICHGILLAEDGAKLSKKLRNYTEPEEIFVSQGADALRWYLMSSAIVRGGDLRISDTGIDDVVRQVLLPIWNAYSFFTLYANADNYKAEFRTNSEQLLDKYLLAKTRLLIESVTERMDAYDISGATTEIHNFIDALNNWYIRRSRNRFWAKSSDDNELDKRDAHDTLYTVLVTLSRVSAPFLPMIMEEIHTGLTESQSVHLCDWPDPSSLPSDPDLVKNMDLIREIASTALRLREESGLRVRLPLNCLTIAGTEVAIVPELTHLLTDEVNVKSVQFSEDINQYASFTLQPNGGVLGPRLGGKVQEVFAAARSGDFIQNDDGTVTICDEVLEPSEFELALNSPEGTTAATLSGANIVVVLDAELTPELQIEGLARDVVRQVQQARREADLVVTDRIKLWLEGSEDLLQAVSTHESYVASQVLATEILIGKDGEHVTEVEIEGHTLTIGLRVADI